MVGHVVTQPVDGALRLRRPIGRREGEAVVRSGVQRVHLSSDNKRPTQKKTIDERRRAGSDGDKTPQRRTSMVMPSSHLPSTHRSKLSMPMNQSGDGTILAISETCAASIYERRLATPRTTSASRRDVFAICITI